MAVVGNPFVVNYLKDATSSLRLFEMGGDPQGESRCPALGTVAAALGRAAAIARLFYAFTSFLYPTTIYPLRLRSRG